MISLIEPDAIYSAPSRQAELEDIRQGLERVDQLVEAAMADVRALYDYIETLERQLGNRRSAPARRGEGSKIMLVPKHGDGGYIRSQPLIIVEWVCAICQQHHQRSQVPGITPKYCLPLPGEKLSECQRAARRKSRALYQNKHKVIKDASFITDENTATPTSE